MKIYLPLGGDDFGTFFKNIYFRMLKDKEPVMTTFNGISAIVFPDESGVEYARQKARDFRETFSIDAVKCEFLGEVERKDPSGFTEVEEIEGKYKKGIREVKEREKLVKTYISCLKTMNHSAIAVSDVVGQLEDIMKYEEPPKTKKP